MDAAQCREGEMGTHTHTLTHMHTHTHTHIQTNTHTLRGQSVVIARALLHTNVFSQGGGGHDRVEL